MVFRRSIYARTCKYLRERDTVRILTVVNNLQDLEKSFTNTLYNLRIGWSVGEDGREIETVWQACIALALYADIIQETEEKKE